MKVVAMIYIILLMALSASVTWAAFDLSRGDDTYENGYGDGYEMGAWHVVRYHEAIGNYPSYGWRHKNLYENYQNDEDILSSSPLPRFRVGEEYNESCWEWIECPPCVENECLTTCRKFVCGPEEE